jgi:hypothetical protein
MSILSCKPAHELPTRAEEHRCLIKDLRAQEAVGIVGGEAKGCKLVLALDLAVAVAPACAASWCSPRRVRGAQ